MHALSGKWISISGAMVTFGEGGAVILNPLPCRFRMEDHE
jgi:hypothetical protein